MIEHNRAMQSAWVEQLVEIDKDDSSFRQFIAPYVVPKLVKYCLSNIWVSNFQLRTNIILLFQNELSFCAGGTKKIFQCEGY